MTISIDYDYTYSLDPATWNQVIQVLQAAGHQVYCVSARHYWQTKEIYESVGKEIGLDKCFLTDRLAKRDYMLKRGIQVDVWIDDTPEAIIEDKQERKLT